MAVAPELRPIEPADRPFLLELYAELRAPDVQALGLRGAAADAFVAQQFDAQSSAYAQYPGLASQLILDGGGPVGRLLVARWEDELRIVDVAITAAARGRGIGTLLLEQVQREAHGRGIPATIHVERFNPAWRLYARLGFELAEEREDGVYVLLRSAPARTQAKTAS